MTSIPKPVAVVRAINEQRGCPHLMEAATEIGSVPVEQLSPDGRKQEYYFLLEDVLHSVMGQARDFRQQFPYGLVEYDNDGKPASSLPIVEQRAALYIASGDFQTATYWAHSAIHRTIHIATEQWLAETDKSSAYQRINSLVDDSRQSTYGDVAIQKRVSSAANQAVNISCSFQRMTDHHFPLAEGHPIRPDEMDAAHAENLRLAMPLTQFHLNETRPIREALGSLSLPGSMLEVYTNPEYFTFADSSLQFADMRLVERMAGYSGRFADGRVGCPGAKYVPEVWEWTGKVAAQFALPALEHNQ